MARLESGAGLGESRSAAGISTSTEPTLYGPVYGGKAGVGLKRENHDILSLVIKLGGCFAANWPGHMPDNATRMVETKTVYGNDGRESIAVWRGKHCNNARDSRKVKMGGVSDIDGLLLYASAMGDGRLLYLIFT